MSENILFLIIGGAMGLISSLVTVWFQNKLAQDQWRKDIEIKKREKIIEEAREFLNTKDLRILKYGSVSPVRLGDLIVEHGPDQGKSFRLNKNIILVGKGKHDCDVVLSDPTVSNIHFRLILADKACVIEEIQSESGTRINHNLLTRPLVLSNTDVIEIGNSTLHLRLVEEETK